MGVDLKDLVSQKIISLEELQGKSLAVDAHNALYQFLAIIRQPTGEPLTDMHGRVTSHLSGLLYRNSNLVEKGLKLVYVFDGRPPLLKAVEINRRKQIKEQATVKYEEAFRKRDFEEARIYAQLTSKLDDSMVEDAKKLLDLLGIPWIQAPSEGEAQAAYLALKNIVWGTASQDYDSLLFGAPRLVRNLTLTGRRKLPRKNLYVEVNLQILELDKVLNELGITREQLIDIGILIGTDFNPDGIKGIGPKTALRMVKENEKLENILSKLPAESFPCDPLEIKNIFLKPEVTDDYRIEWKPPNVEGAIKFLCGERNFSEERVRKTLEKMSIGFSEAKGKSTLESWFS